MEYDRITTSEIRLEMLRQLKDEGKQHEMVRSSVLPNLLEFCNIDKTRCGSANLWNTAQAKHLINTLMAIRKENSTRNKEDEQCQDQI